MTRGTVERLNSQLWWRYVAAMPKPMICPMINVMEKIAITNVLELPLTPSNCTWLCHLFHEHHPPKKRIMTRRTVERIDFGFFMVYEVSVMSMHKQSPVPTSSFCPHGVFGHTGQMPLCGGMSMHAQSPFRPSPLEYLVKLVKHPTVVIPGDCNALGSLRFAPWPTLREWWQLSMSCR